MPDGMVNYSTVPADSDFFTATTIPQGLLKDHSTKDGTWAIIRVFQGKLEYVIEETLKFEITPFSNQGIIEPNRKHHVKALTDDVQFVVEFHRLADTGPVDEPREGL
eukprot:CAMPEP_0178904968 /NCGR_PEP_ID=MMETSP0786-20121207/5991_1 /TAXON_ID=186022 /ORGANISM="Thalassionema frauenfeldii, Strain CCMP 1798" /LENGTH=106 /DNA_ID=CAMNT_0020576477 /DNA_START=144 /DNA_END=464 /DNA_ORIENTATION=-